MDVAKARGPRGANDIDRFIAKRHAQRVKEEGERPEYELWEASVQEFNAKERERILWERLRYHDAMVRAHTATSEAIIARHQAEAGRIEQELG